MVMLGVMCIKISVFTAAAAHLGWLFCGAEQVGDSPGPGLWKGCAPFPQEGWQFSGRERAHSCCWLCSRDLSACQPS